LLSLGELQPLFPVQVFNRHSWPVSPASLPPNRKATREPEKRKRFPADHETVSAADPAMVSCARRTRNADGSGLW
jgi:hypothetical protein